MTNTICPDMRSQLFVVCEYATLSADNKLSVIGIFDRVPVPSFPFRQASFWVAASLRLDQADLGAQRTFEIIVRNPLNVWTALISETRALPPSIENRPPRGLNLALNLVDFIYPQAGTYLFELRINEQRLAEVDVMAVQA